MAQSFITRDGLSLDVFHSPAENVTWQGSTDFTFQPTAFALIHGKNEAILVDAPATVKASKELADWISLIAPGKKLTLYVTHGHGDHYFGITTLRERFPDIRLRATAGVVEHMREQLESPIWDLWQGLFPAGQLPHEGLIKDSFDLVDEIDATGQFTLEERHVFQVIDVGEGDTYNSTVLFVPKLSLVIGGDVIYGQCFQLFFHSSSVELQDKWIDSLSQIAALKPQIVVPAHMLPDEGYGVEHISQTAEYIKRWRTIVPKASSWEELEVLVRKEFPKRGGSTWVLRCSCQLPFNAAF